MSKWEIFRGHILKTSLIIISFIETFYIAYQPTPRDGLEAMWLLPFLFGTVLIFFGEIIKYHKGGVGLKVYYIIAIIRFLVQPILIVLSKGALSFNRMPNAEPNSYRVAIVTLCIELLMACFAIKRWYPKYINKISSTKSSIKKNQGKLRASGWFMIGACLFVLAIRFQIWFPAMNILALKSASSDTSILIEATLINCVKAIIFVNFLRLAKDSPKYSKKYYAYLILALVAGIFNFIIYFGANRSFIVESAIASIALIVFVFPKYKKRVLTITVPISVVIIIMMFVTKQFGLENANQFTFSAISIKDISNIIEEYTNGLWTVARSYQAALGLTVTQSVEALSKDITDGLLVVLDIPGLDWIASLTSDFSSSSDIMKQSLGSFDRGQMLSFSGGMLIIGGQVSGWILVLLANYMVIKILVKLEVLSKQCNNFYYKYMYLWMAILFGLTHCYTLQTLIYSWSKFILFYWAIIWINNKFVFRK